MPRMRRYFVVLAAATAVFGVAACGDDDSTPVPSTPGDATAGKSVFTANCGGCHTLADAETTGSNGPNLDTLKPTRDAVAAQVTNGGGGMPAFSDSLSADDIANVAAYVASATGS